MKLIYEGIRAKVCKIINAVSQVNIILRLLSWSISEKSLCLFLHKERVTFVNFLLLLAFSADGDHSKAILIVGEWTFSGVNSSIHAILSEEVSAFVYRCSGVEGNTSMWYSSDLYRLLQRWSAGLLILDILDLLAQNV